MRYNVTAEHGNGASVGHPCVDGIYTDAADRLDIEVEAVDDEAAERIGRNHLDRLVAEAEPCHCRRHWQPGSNRWWDSVSVIAAPCGELDTPAEAN